MNATLEQIPDRKTNDWITPGQLRALLKNSLKLNARQTTVSKSHSQQYLEITIRDATVNIPQVQQFARMFHTWSMDNTDYCCGQSVHVHTTAEVDAIHAAPWIEEIKRTIPLCEVDSGKGMSNGTVLWLDRQGFYVGRDQERGQYVNQWDAQNGTDWAVLALALSMARV